MALSTADCDAMLRAAKGTGIKLMVGHVLRLMFPWWRIKELAREDELGAPVCVSIRRYHSRSGGGWRARTELSGGSLFEVNIHELDLMRHLCGEVSQVSAYEGRLGCGERDHDEVYLINFRFRSGAVGHLQGGATTGGALYEGQVMCPGGVLSFGPAWGTGAVQRGDGDRQPLAAEGRTGPVGVDWELDSFMRWVTDDEPPVVTAEDGRAAVRLAEAARRAITDGVPVDLL